MDVERRTIKKRIFFLCSLVAYFFRRERRREHVHRPQLNDQTRGFNEAQRIIGLSDRICHEQLRMNRRSFFNLRDLIRDKGLLGHSTGVTLEEQLVMFLHILGHNLSCRLAGLHYGHSTATISRHFNGMLKAIVALYPVLVTPPSVNTPVEISSDPTRFPYFQVFILTYFCCFHTLICTFY